MIIGRLVLLVSAEPAGWGGKRSAFPAECRFCIVRKETEEIVGQVNYCGYTGKSAKVEIGIEIDYSDRGKGYGEDALYHFLDYLFLTMHVRLVKLAVMVNNQVARQLYQKLGFLQDKLVQAGGYDAAAETFADIVLMGLTADRWLVQRRKYVFKT